jgi:DNA-binding NarL/FixJ family response regulator
MKPIRVVLIENHEAVRAGIRLLLERIPEVQVAAEAANVTAGLRAVRLHQPDVVLLDIPLSESSKSERVKRVTQKFPGVRVILLSLAIHGLLHKRAFQASAMSQGIAQGNLQAEGLPTELTVRQQQVLHLIAEGQNTKQIAHSLGIGVKTVETHRAHLMERLNIRSIAGLVRHAMGMELASSEDCPLTPLVRPLSSAA